MFGNSSGMFGMQKDPAADPQPMREDFKNSYFNPLGEMEQALQPLGDRGRKIGSSLYDLTHGGNWRDAMDVGTNLLGGAGEAVTTIPAFLMDLATPDAVTTPLFNAIAESETVQEGFAYVEKFKKEHPERAQELGWALNIAEFAPMFKAIHQIPKNMDTQVKGFYGGGGAGKIAGVAMLLPDTTRRFVQQLTSPKGTAIERELGVSQGLLEQNQRMLQYADNDKTKALISQLEDLKAKRKERKLNRGSSEADKNSAAYLDEQIELTRRDLMDERSRLSDQYNRDKELGKAEDPSYQRGALEYAYLYDKQIGRDTKFLNDVYGKFNVVDSGTMARVDFDNLITKPSGNPYGNPKVIASMMDTDATAEAVMSNLHSRLMTWHGKGRRPQDVHLVVKDPFSQERMSQEFFGTQATNTAKNLTSGAIKMSPEDFADPSKVKNKIALAQLSADDRNFYLDTLNGKQRTKESTRRRFESIQQTIKNKERNIKYDEANGLYTFAETLVSRSKALGGMNHAFVMDKKGNVMGLPNDGHDLFGIDPVGGKPLINVYPPFSFNAISDRGKSLGYFEKNMRSPQAANVQKKASGMLTDTYGVDVTSAAPKSTAVQTQVARTIRDAADAVNPQARDYLEAGVNTVGLGTALGNQLGSRYQPQEQQQGQVPSGLLTGRTGRFL